MTASQWWEHDLDELRWHWDTADAIHYHPDADLWTAERRDDHTTLKADTATGLRDVILADYTARPVSRQVAGVAWSETPSRRFLPEG